MTLNRILTLLSVAALTGSAWLSPLSAQTLNPAGKPFPNVNLNRPTKGKDIESALGGASFHSVADWYGHTDADFRALCKRDKSLAADHKGRLHYVCAGTVAAGSTSDWGISGVTYTAPFPDSQTFLLHSKPGASKVIYLDFDGNTTSGTYWNTTYTGGENIVTPPYDMDGNAAFSSAELANIQVIWQSVAEDYAPFDVDVTTQDPGLEALRKTSANDSYYGIRVCIGGSGMDWYGALAGGITYLNSFNWSTDTPAFVFPVQLGLGNPKFVAEAISHEVGHSFGLHHDGQTNGIEYYAGQGAWAPIMGVGYYKDIVQWSKGEYTMANNVEDDFAIINSYLAPQTDAVGDDMAHATALSGNAISVSGLIEKKNVADVDVYSFSSAAGAVNFTAKPVSSSANLNVLLSLYNATGSVIATAGPGASTSGVSLSKSVAAGTYYVAVNGVGSGDPVSAGFSNYGSVGQYTLTGTLPTSANNEAPTASASASTTKGNAPLPVNFSSSGSKDSDGTISSYAWTFGDGTTSRVANPSHTYAAPGTYSATLVVYDNKGAASAPVSITVTVNSAPTIYVANISMSTKKVSKGNSATATVTIRDLNGAVKTGAKVSGVWSGVVSGSASGNTSASGTVAFTSGSSNTKRNFTFTVTSVTLPGYTYNSSLNTKTSNSIAPP